MEASDTFRPVRRSDSEKLLGTGPDRQVREILLFLFRPHQLSHLLDRANLTPREYRGQSKIPIGPGTVESTLGFVGGGLRVSH